MNHLLSSKRKISKKSNDLLDATQLSYWLLICPSDLRCLSLVYNTEDFLGASPFKVYPHMSTWGPEYPLYHRVLGLFPVSTMGSHPGGLDFGIQPGYRQSQPQFPHLPPWASIACTTAALREQ